MIIFHAGRMWNQPKCGAGTRKSGASTNNIGSVVGPEEWNKLADVNKCKRCLEVIRKAKAKRDVTQ